MSAERKKELISNSITGVCDGKFFNRYIFANIVVAYWFVLAINTLQITPCKKYCSTAFVGFCATYKWLFIFMEHNFAYS